METIFVVSPEYLSAVFTEVKKYDFQMQGYGTFHNAKKGIMRVNALDLLGVAFLNSVLPKHNSAEFQSMMEFLHLCDLMHSDKKVIFVVKAGVSSIAKELKQFKNLRIFEVSNFEMVSDTLINKSIFGSLLLDNYEPYMLKHKEQIPVGNFSGPKLEYKPIISEQLLLCISDVAVLDTLEHTLEYDKVYNSFRDINSDLAVYRIFYVKQKMQLNSSYEEKIIDNLLQKYQHDNSLFWPVMLAMFEYIKSGGYIRDVDNFGLWTGIPC